MGIGEERGGERGKGESPHLFSVRKWFGVDCWRGGGSRQKIRKKEKKKKRKRDEPIFSLVYLYSPTRDLSRQGKRGGKGEGKGEKRERG